MYVEGMNKVFVLTTEDLLFLIEAQVTYKR